MKDTYIVKRNKKGRFTKLGYMFDDNKLLKQIDIRYKSWGYKLFWIGLVLGILVGVCI